MPAVSPTPPMGTDTPPAPTSRLPRLYTALVSVWGIGTILLLLWLGVCQWHLTRLRRAAHPLSSSPAANALAALTTHPPRLLAHPAVRSPFLAGVLRPAIFLPDGAEADFPPDALRAILAHELAHLARRDCAWTLGCRVLCAVLWPQPLLWLLCRRLEAIGEEACDLSVLAQDCPPRAYADCLLTLAEHHPLPRRERALGAGVAPFRSSLGRRVQRILAQGTHAMSTIPLRLRLTIAALTLAAVIGGAFIVSPSPAQVTPSSLQSPHGVGMLAAKDPQPEPQTDTSQGDQARFLAGMTPVDGPGVVVTLNDSKKPYPKGLPPGMTPPNLVHDTDINQTVNELRAAGAEAIAVNGQRLVATSAIRCAGPTVFINNVPQAPPYTVQAIGDPQDLEAALNLRGGMASQLKIFDPAMFSSRIDALLTLPAYAGANGLRYARPLDNKAASQNAVRFLAGMTPVEGPGVVVTLNDSKTAFPQALPRGMTPPNLIHDTDINQVINELRAAGAEAIAVNGQRLVATSAVRDTGPTIFVNNTPQTPPYAIQAIGDSKTLASALAMRGGSPTRSNRSTRGCSRSARQERWPCRLTRGQTCRTTQSRPLRCQPQARETHHGPTSQAHLPCTPSAQPHYN